MEIEIFIQAYLVDCGDLCQFINVFPLIVSVDPTGTTIQYIYLHPLWTDPGILNKVWAQFTQFNIGAVLLTSLSA